MEKAEFEKLTEEIIAHQGKLAVGGAPEGYQPMVLADLARRDGGRLVYIARDASAAIAMRDMLAFFAPDITTLSLPAWDCLPYDRLSPQVAVMSERMATLAQLPLLDGQAHILITTISAAAQRLPARDKLAELSLAMKPGNVIDVDALTQFLSSNGYARCSTVMEPGDYAVRGGIIDLYAPGSDTPVRLDLFGDTLESIRPFEVESQRTVGQLSALNLTAAGEIHLDDEAVLRFRRGYVQAFGTVMDNDPLYVAISEGARYQGMEHWLPLFHDTLETLFDHCGGALYIADDQTESALNDRYEQIADYYQAREEAMQAHAKDRPKESDGRRIIKPLAPDALYILNDEWQQRINENRWRSIGAFETPDGVNLSGRAGRCFAAERKQQNINLFDAVTAHINAEQTAGRPVLLVASSRGAQERLETLLKEHNAPPIEPLDSWRAPQSGQGPRIAIMGMENGFSTDMMSVLTEQDILGDRMVRRPGRKLPHRSQQPNAR
ncbi:hypothetical protein N9X51_05245 [Alphaproteobacteria bacterium]|nr:hypothetical protein [Alphaproteobacteria bacterium]